MNDDTTLKILTEYFFSIIQNGINLILSVTK